MVKIPKLKRWQKIILLIVVALVLFMIVRRKPDGAKLEVAVVGRSTLSESVTASGKTDVRTGEAVYAQVSSTIKEIKVKSGTPVTQGDTIMLLDNASLVAASTGAYTSYLTANTNLINNEYEKEALEADVKAKRFIRDQAQEDYNGDDGDDNKQALKTAEANYQNSIADLNSLRAKEAYLTGAVTSTYSSFLSANKNLRNSKVTAPSAGTLALQDIKIGESVTAGDRLFSVINTGSIAFIAEVDETDISKVGVGKKTTVTLDSDTETQISGTVAEVLGATFTTDSGSTAVKVVVSMNEGSFPAITGLNGEAEIEFETKEGALALPVDYLEEDEEGEFVWEVQNCQAKKSYIETGIESYDLIEVTSGLNEGAKVVKGDGIKEGDKTPC